jgi:low temperature requirement protein LtrA
MIYLAKRKKKEKVKTYTDDIMSYVWLAFVISMVLTAFVLGRVNGAEYYKLVNPFFLMLYGIPTFLSGIILKFRPLIIGGIACWVLSVVATFIPYNYQLLLLSVAMLVAWIIPGYALKSKYNKQQ